MCYICEARGTVGVGYRAAQKECTAALAAWGRVGGRPKRNPDHQNAPATGKRLWSNADLKEYGKEWRREHLT